MTITERYIYLKDAFTDPDRKESFISLMSYLEEHTEYLNAPASNKYHCSYKHGLLEHSVNVTETLIKLNKALNAGISMNSCILVGLTHDCGKSDQYIIKEPTPKQLQYGFPGSIVYTDNGVWLDHATQSLKIVSQFIECTDEEWAAIAYHNEPHNGTLSEWHETKLGLLLQYADYYSARFLEIDGETKTKREINELQNS